MPPNSERQAMKSTTIRFPPAAHAVLTEAAAQEGVDFSAYVREAAMARWAFERGVELGRGRRSSDQAKLRVAQRVLQELRTLLTVAPR